MDRAEPLSRRTLVVAAAAAGVGGITTHVLTRYVEGRAATTELVGRDGRPLRASGSAAGEPGVGGAPPRASAASPGAPPASASLDPNVPLEPPGAQSPDAKVPKPVKKLGWAVVGLGKLALEQVLPAFGAAKNARLVALVSGHPDKAKQVAEVYGLDAKNIYDYDNFDTIKDNPAIDVVYVILPNSMHAEFTIRGFKAGKHVLTEKPMAPTLDDCQRMIDAGHQAGKKLMVAYRLHYEPRTQRLVDMCRTRELGPIHTIEASNVEVVHAPNIRLSGKLAGGPLADLGIYCINGIRFALGEEPTEVTATLDAGAGDPRFREVPAGYAFTMRFPSGVIAHADTHFAGARSHQCRVHCENGYIEVDQAYGYDPPELRVNRDKQGTTRPTVEPVNQFASEMDHFTRCILENKEPDTPGAEGLADMRVIKAIEQAARTGTTVKVAT